MNEVEKMTMKTPDGTATSIAALKNLFPEIVTEGKVDFDALKTILGGEVAGDERYQFTWAGKRAAMIEAAKPITKTLRPCPEQSKNWDATQNIYIEGDNLDALKILQATYAGKVKMIYIDPPYNTGKDFIYHDNFHGTKQQEQVKEGTIDAETGVRFKANTESNGYFHSDWCSMMYPRLKLARQLLREDGVIFISIDDAEVSNARKLCDEIFGEGNFVAGLIHQRAKGGGQAKHVVKGHDYIWLYSKDINQISLGRRKVVQKKTVIVNGVECIKNDDVVRKVFGKYDKSLGDRRCYYEELIQYKGEDKKQEIDALIANGELFLEENDAGMHTICRYEPIDEARSKLYSIIKVLSEEGKKDLEDLGVAGFTYPKPTELLRQLVDSVGDEDALILDFFSGSATTAHAVMQLNAEDGGKRKFIMVQLPELTYEIKNGHKVPLPQSKEAFEAGYENICEIGEKRIDLAGEKIKAENATVAQDLDIGFRVFKVDSSNMEDIYYAPKDVQQADLLHVVNNVKPDRKPIDLLYGCLVDWGLPIDLPHETKTINGHEVFSVGGGVLMACFDQNVDDATVKAIAAEKPSHALFRDTSFVSSAAKINVGEIFKALSPETKVRVL